MVEPEAKKLPRRGKPQWSIRKIPNVNDGKWMTTEGNKRKAREESEENNT